MKKLFLLLTVFILSTTLSNSVSAELELICDTWIHPVCWEVYGECFWDICTTVEPRKETFSNLCELNNKWAKFLYKGSCKDDIEVDVWIDDIEIKNPDDFKNGDGKDLIIEAEVETKGLPQWKIVRYEVGVYDEDNIKVDWCKASGIVWSTYGDELKWDFNISCWVDEFDDLWAKYRFEVIVDKYYRIEESNEDNNEKMIYAVVGRNIIQPPVNNLDAKLKLRADKALLKFYERLDQKYLDREERIETLEELISKLKSLSKKKPKYASLISYMVSHIEDKIDEYRDEFDDIFDILK